MRIVNLLLPGFLALGMYASTALGQDEPPITLDVEKVNAGLSAKAKKMVKDNADLSSLSLSFDNKQTDFKSDKVLFIYNGVYNKTKWSNEDTQFDGWVQVKMSRGDIPLTYKMDFAGENSLNTDTVKLFAMIIDVTAQKRCADLSQIDPLDADQVLAEAWCDAFTDFEIETFDDVADFLVQNTATKISSFQKTLRSLKKARSNTTDEDAVKVFTKIIAKLNGKITLITKMRTVFDENDAGERTAINVTFSKDFDLSGVMPLITIGTKLNSGSIRITKDSINSSVTGTKTRGLIGYTLFKRRVIIPYLDGLQRQDDSRASPLMSLFTDLADKYLKNIIFK